MDSQVKICTSHENLYESPDLKQVNFDKISDIFNKNNSKFDYI